MCRHCTALGKAVSGLYGDRPFPLPVSQADPVRQHFDCPLPPDSLCVTRAQGAAARGSLRAATAARAPVC